MEIFEAKNNFADCFNPSLTCERFKTDKAVTVERNVLTDVTQLAWHLKVIHEIKPNKSENRKSASIIFSFL